MAFAILWYARNRRGRATKESQFGSDFKVQIIVDSDCEVVRPCRKITGNVVIETLNPIKHQGIINSNMNRHIKILLFIIVNNLHCVTGLLIQFEGMCILKYSTKFEGYTTNHKGKEILLENASWKSDEGYFQSPIQQVLQPRSGKLSK